MSGSVVAAASLRCRGAGGERDEAHLDRHQGDRPPRRRRPGRSAPRASRATSARRSSQSAMSVWYVVSVLRPLAIHGSPETVAPARPWPRLISHGPVLGPIAPASSAGSAAASSLTVRDAERGQPAGGPGADAPQRVGRAVAEEREPRLVGDPVDPGGLAELGGQLGLQLVLSNPDRAARARSPRARAGGCRGRSPPDRRCRRPTNASSQPSTSTTPPGRSAGRPSPGRTPRRTPLVGRQEHRLRAPCAAPSAWADRSARRTPAPRTRPCHHAALGRVAVAAHHHRAPTQLGSAQHLHRRDELVHVDMEHPAGHISTPCHGS